MAFCLSVKNQTCDQRVLQSKWLKAFPAITQKTTIFKQQSFLRSFPTKTNEKILQHNGKTLILGYF